VIHEGNPRSDSALTENRPLGSRCQRVPSNLAI
jgi:hypothetical protein